MLEKIGTLLEIETQFSPKDIMDAHEALDIRAEAEEYEREKEERKRKGN